MKKSKHIVGGASIAVLLAAGIVGNSLCSIYYSQIQAYMQRFVTSSESANSMTDLSRDDAYTQALQLCEEVESEGLVLLKTIMIPCRWERTKSICSAITATRRFTPIMAPAATIMKIRILTLLMVLNLLVCS